MYAPRRHSRRLLLPPGWVALGFLLLLGCQVLLAHERQLRTYSVMQLTVPSLKMDSGALWNNVVYKSPAELGVLRHWHNTEFIGMPLTDFVNAAQTESIALAMQVNNGQEKGVRIRFGKHATYDNLVEALDIMNRVNQPKYWLDIIHNPLTLYAITEKLTSSESGQLAMPPCGGMSYCSSQSEPSFQQRLTAFWQPAWRPVALLLAVFSALSLYRLKRSCLGIR